MAERTNGLQVTTSFGAVLLIPADQITRRETVPSTSPPQPAAAPAAPAKPAVTVAPAVNPPASPKPAPPPKPVVPPPVAAKPGPSPSTNTAAAVFRKFLADWTGNADLGLNLGFSTKDRQTYSGRFQATHAHAMANTHLLRNTLDYIFSYGQIEGVPSDDRMDGSWKIDYGLAKRFSLYSVIGAGYDEIRHIDHQFDLGPGFGYKWITRTNFVLSTELGGNYQQQRFSNNTTKERFALRLAEESWWQVSSKLRLDQKIEIFPDVSELSEYRVRGEANLAYALRNNLSVKLTVIDLYETYAPANVSNNDLQIRSSISVRF